MDRPALRRRLWAAAPAVAALAVYASTLGAGFLYDDDTLIRTNRWVQDANVVWRLPLKPLLASPGMGNTNYYRPLVNILYNLTWQSLGGRPLAFHLLNVLVHMLNATLLMMLVRRITGARGMVAIGAALLFAVHPLNSEVVAWPSCLPELGFVAFGLAALLFHLGARDETGAAALRMRAAAWVSFGLACSCKETALAFLPLVVLLELSFHARLLGALRSAVPYLAAATVYLAARTAVLGGIGPRGAHGLRTFADSVWNAPWLLLLYVKSMAFPSPLLIEHVVPLAKSAADARFLAGFAVAGIAAAGLLRLHRARPDLALAACLVVIPVLPALYLPALGRDPFAERYAYLGVAGFCWLIVGGAEALMSRPVKPAPAWLFPTFLYVLVITASARTAARCGDWYDDGTLGKASIRDEPKAPIGYLLEGMWHNREGRKEDALRVFQRGLETVPESVELQQNAIGLGVELGHMTRDDVIAAYERLVPLAWGSPSAQFNLGHALLEGGRVDEAEKAFNRALELSPTSIASMTALAVIASKKGDPAAAVALCRRALAIDDHSTAALQQLGVALIRTGDFDGAIGALERAVAIAPADVESLNRLGVAYARVGRNDDAGRAWEKALAIDPDLSSARQNLEHLRQKSR